MDTFSLADIFADEDDDVCPDHDLRPPSESERTSQYIGVYWHKKAQGWAAQFKFKGHTTYLGLFDTDAEAAKAYDIAVYEKGRRIALNFGLPSQEELQEFRRSGNRFSRKRVRASIYRGVSWNAERRMWKSSIQKKGRKIYIGRFNTEEEAARAYNRRALELLGRKAVLNKVPDTHTRYPTDTLVLGT